MGASISATAAPHNGLIEVGFMFVPLNKRRPEKVAFFFDRRKQAGNVPRAVKMSWPGIGRASDREEPQTAWGGVAIFAGRTGELLV